MDSNWKLKIVPNQFRAGFSIMLYRKIGNKIQFQCMKEQPVFEIREFPENETYTRDGKNPVFAEFSMGTMMDCPDILSQLQEELHEMGVKSPDKSFAEGKLAATEKHLEDMRTLLKLKENT